MVFKNNPALTETVVLEGQWTDLPEEVVDDIRQLWQDYEFGNDNYYYSWGKHTEKEEYPVLAKYLDEAGVESCLIHYWW
jgi:hypothetical protein